MEDNSAIDCKSSQFASPTSILNDTLVIGNSILQNSSPTSIVGDTPPIKNKSSQILSPNSVLETTCATEQKTSQNTSAEVTFVFEPKSSQISSPNSILNDTPAFEHESSLISSGNSMSENTPAMYSKYHKKSNNNKKIKKEMQESTEVAIKNLSNKVPESLPYFSPDSNENIPNSRNENSTFVILNQQNSINETTLTSTIMSGAKDSVEDPTVLESTSSEYVAEISIQTTSNSIQTSLKDKSPVIKDNLNINTITVPHSNQRKKHFCLFCKTLQTKYARHLFLKHKNEKQVKIALKLPKKSLQRLQIIDELRKRGDFLHNTKSTLNTGILITRRNQQIKLNKKADNFACCKYCQGFYDKSSIRGHSLICGDNTETKNRTSLVESRKLTQYVHPLANDKIKTKVLPILRNDKIYRTLVYDELIIKFGNQLTENTLMNTQIHTIMIWLGHNYSYLQMKKKN
uniref:Uncharacterized protein n=1 Tax=Stomoxys calcitrans TaxID=35570 RepID=A0A1I8Q2E9_STOCA